MPKPNYFLIGMYVKSITADETGWTYSLSLEKGGPESQVLFFDKPLAVRVGEEVRLTGSLDLQVGGEVILLKDCRISRPRKRRRGESVTLDEDEE